MKRILEFIDTDNNQLAKEVLDLAIEIFKPIKSNCEFCLVAFRVEGKGTAIRFSRLNIDDCYQFSFPEFGPDISNWINYVREFDADMNSILEGLKIKLSVYLENKKKNDR